MATRSHAFIRGLYANAQNHQHLSSFVRRTSREAVASTDRSTKRKRAEDENLVTLGASNLLSQTEPRFDNELFSCLFDQNNRCTIFDLDEPSTASNVPSMEMELESFKLSPSSMNMKSEPPEQERFKLSPTSMAIPSEPPALVQIVDIPAQKLAAVPVPIKKEAESKVVSDLDFLSLLDPTILPEANGTEATISVPTMEMKRCKLSSSRPKCPNEFPALVQVNVTSIPYADTAQSGPPPMQNIYQPGHPRNRPFKNVRERRRRAQMKNKFMTLYNLCCSKVVNSLVSQPSAEARGLQIPICGSIGPPLTLVNHEPSKVEILGEAIQAFEALDKELSELRARNKELKVRALQQT